MLTVTFDINIDAVARDFDRLVDDIDDDLVRDGYAAAEAGIMVPYNRHPYTDRTYNLTTTMTALPPDAEGMSTMHAAAEYASFVNAKPRFEFMSRAESHAERELGKLVRETINRAVRRFKGR